MADSILHTLYIILISYLSLIAVLLISLVFVAVLGVALEATERRRKAARLRKLARRQKHNATVDHQPQHHT